MAKRCLIAVHAVDERAFRNICRSVTRLPSFAIARIALGGPIGEVIACAQFPVLLFHTVHHIPVVEVRLIFHRSWPEDVEIGFALYLASGNSEILEARSEE